MISALKKMEKKEAFKYIYKNYTFIFSFLILLIVATAFSDGFSYLSYRNLSTLMLQTTIKGVLAIGMTLIIISGNIDLSVGSSIALVSGLGVVVLNSTSNPIITLLFCMCFGAMLSAINGVLITKGKIAPFIVTLATMCAYRSIIVQLGQGGPFHVSNELVPTFRMIAQGKILGVPNLAIIFVIVAVIISLVMTKTKFGRYVYGVGSNKQAIKLMGIDTDKVIIKSFMIMGLLTGLSSFLLMSRLTSITAANVGVSYELDAIAAVAIGGTAMDGGRGRIIGTFFGAIMLQMIEGILILANIPPFLTGLVKGVIIIVAVLFQRKKAN